KVMRPEVAAGENARERFLREGRAAAAVKSDHVITIYQVGEANGVPFLAMEFLAGSTLNDWLKGRGGSAPVAAIVKVAKDTLRGLGAAHDLGLIHRDIKPANLWLEAGTGRVKVLDFGLTRGSGADDVLTREGALVGTPSYMAPEQAAGRPVDPRADLFSVGVVLYRMAVGRNPFQRGDVYATLTALAVDVPPPAGSVAAGLPAGLGALIDRLVAKNAADRPESARAALAELAEIERAMKGGAAAGVPVVNVPVVYAPPAAVPDANPWAAVTEAVTEVDREPDPAAPAVPRPPREAGKRSVVPLAAGVVGLAVVAAGAVGLALMMRGPGEVAKTDLPAPKPPEEVFVPAAGPEVKAGPSPFDALDPAKIPPAERVPWLPKETVAVIGGHRGDIRNWTVGNHIHFSPNGKQFATGSRNLADYSGVTLYNAMTLEVVWHDPRAGAFAFSPDGSRLAVSVVRQSDGFHGVRLIDVTDTAARGDKELAFRDEKRTHAVAWLPDGKTLLTGTGSGGLYAWDVTGPGVVPTRTYRNAGETAGRVVQHLAVSTDGRRMVDADVHYTSASFVGVWDVAGEVKERFRIPGGSSLQALALALDGDRLVLLMNVVNKGQSVEVWRLDGPQPVRAHYTEPNNAYLYSSLGPVTADGKHVFIAGEATELWQLGPDRLTKARAIGRWVAAAAPDLSRLVQVSGHRFKVLGGDGKALVEPGEQTAGSYHAPVGVGGRVMTFFPTARSWTARDGGLVAEDLSIAEDLASSHTAMTTVSPDGRLVAGLGRDMVIRVLAVDPGGVRFHTRIAADQHSPVNRFGHFQFQWHPVGKRLVTPHEDGSASIWDVSTDPAGRQPFPVRPNRSFALAPTGEAIAEFVKAEKGVSVAVRRAAAPTAERVLPGQPDEVIRSAAFAPEGRWLYVAAGAAGTPDHLRQFDLTKRQPAAETVWRMPTRETLPGPQFHALTFSRDGRRLLGVTRTRIYVLDRTTHSELLGMDLSTLYYTPNSIQACWADDGRHVLLGQHGCVYVLRVPDKR
ncbi:MAG TPA: WD40 repeat domain-containing serine/threonine-protein kinase, partial [Urbifossiella sp.]|nr:WD40 repeat domain-containing serine/threonine-protein kinase [Urbifossiella sp.]